MGPADGDLERSHSSGGEGPSHPVARRQSPKGAPEDPITLSAWGAVSQWYVGSMEWGHQVATQQRQTQDDGTSTHGCRAQDENYKGATCSGGGGGFKSQFSSNKDQDQPANTFQLGST